MPLQNYGVLQARVLEREEGGSNPHYQIHVVSEGVDYRIAINVQSQDQPSELEYHIDDNFKHPITEGLLQLSGGFTALASQPGGLAIDYARSDIVYQQQMKRLPFDIAKSENELNSLLELRVQEAIVDPDALVYAFGQRWGPQSAADQIFHFSPGNGIHNIHMNQGNGPDFASENGSWQDGALFIHLPAQSKWVAIFLKFQSQVWPNSLDS